MFLNLIKCRFSGLGLLMSLIWFCGVIILVIFFQVDGVVYVEKIWVMGGSLVRLVICGVSVYE